MHTSGPFSNEDTADLDLTRIELLKWPRNELAAKVESLRAQRDALLAACEWEQKLQDHLMACEHCEPDAYCVEGIVLTLDTDGRRKDAIAKARGETGGK